MVDILVGGSEKRPCNQTLKHIQTIIQLNTKQNNYPQDAENVVPPSSILCNSG